VVELLTKSIVMWLAHALVHVYRALNSGVGQ